MMTTEFLPKMITDIKIDAEPSDHDENLGEVTIHINIMKRWFSYTEWFSLETYELETVNTQTSTGNSEGYDEFMEFIEDKCGDYAPFGLFETIKPRVNELLHELSIHDAKNAFEKRLEATGISRAVLLEKLNITRQTVANWEKTGKYPHWLHYAIAGIELELKSD